MRSHLLKAAVLVAGLLVAMCTSTAKAAEVSPLDNALGYAANHIIIKFDPAAVDASIGTAGPVSAEELVRQLRLPDGVRLAQPPLSLYGAKNATLANAVDPTRFVCMTVPRSLNAPGLVALMKKHPAVEYAELDCVGSGGATVPNDPSFGLQWHHHNTAFNRRGLPADIRSVEVWDIFRGWTNVTVAVLDTGLFSYTELAGRTVPGYDFVNNDMDPFDDNGHGTAVTGTLAANANNGILVAGVDWNCKIMPLKVLDRNNFGFYSWWAEAVDWAVSNGCKVINLSAGGTSGDITLSNAIENAINQGVIFITITHNDGTSLIRSPAESRT